MVDRVSEAETLARLILRAVQATPSPLVAMHGPGGFGKTTLATQVCHDSLLAATFDTFLWVETGQHSRSSHDRAA